MSEENTKVREAVAVVEDVPSLEMIVTDLKEIGFSDDDISILAGHRTVERLGRGDAFLGNFAAQVDDAGDDPLADETR